jgi:uncharacterized membrane protein
METKVYAPRAQTTQPSIEWKFKSEVSLKGRVQRIDSIDLLRGLVMIVMALDHARYPYFTNLRISPEDVEHSFLALFLTRWVTHFCAPLFFLLAGTGAYLSVVNGRTIKEVSGFLWKRGLWLVFLELTVIAFAWSFNPAWRFGGVIWALGWSMVVMALIIRLPLKVVAAFGITLICLHDLTDTVRPAAFGNFSWLWMILHSGGAIRIESANFTFPILYALIPWVGVMVIGYWLGQVFTWKPERRHRWLLVAGAAMTLAFVLLRVTNLYGNPEPFQTQATVEKTIIAFLNVEKYPPSLQFILMTLGPGLLLLAWLDRFNYRSAFGWLWRKVLVFGRVPMFYYILHLFTLHLLAIICGLILQQPIDWLWGQKLPLSRPAPPGYGHGLPFIYLMTLLTVVLLYFPCKWFAELKRRRNDWWLRYL